MMQSRELMKDAPELDVLLDRCLSTPYDINPYDFFYMQGLSERDKQRCPNFNPSDGHWYGASVCVAGGYCQRKMREAGYLDKVLRTNEEFIRMLVEPEIQTLKGNLTKAGQFLEKRKKLISDLKNAKPSLKEFTSSIIEEWQSHAEEFRKLYEEQLEDVYRNVDFSSPVFVNSRLFLPFKEKRKPNEKELRKFDSTNPHDVYPFVAHLTYQLMK